MTAKALENAALLDALLASNPLASPAKEDADLLEASLGKNASAVLVSLAEQDPVIWAMLYRRLRGKPYIFHMTSTLERMQAQGLPVTMRELVRHRPFLIEPLRNQAKRKVYQKGRQVGITELVTTEELHFLANHPDTKAVHTFPREKQLMDYGNTRLSAALQESPYMRGLLGTPNQTFTKRICEAFLFLRSAWESDLGEGIDLDMLVLDEKDRMKDGIEAAFQEGLSASQYGYEREVSTPTIYGRGVSLTYESSDQRSWFVRCTRCGLEQTVTPEENLVQVKDHKRDAKDTEIPDDAYAYLCKLSTCKGPLDRFHGRWIAAYPERSKTLAGYWMPQTIAPWISASDVIRKKIRYRFQQLWENYVIGRPALSDTQVLSRPDFERVTLPYKFPVPYRTKDFTRIGVGIDWGGSNFVVILGVNANGRKYLLNAFEVADSDVPLASTREIIQRIEPYTPDFILGDAGYGKDRNEYIYSVFPAQTWMCAFSNAGQRRATSLNPSWSEATRRVTVDKLLTVKAACREIRLGNVGFPSLALHPVPLVIQHFESLAPVKHEEDGDVWETMERKGPDHYAMAFVYASLALASATNESTFNFHFF